MVHRERQWSILPRLGTVGTCLETKHVLTILQMDKMMGTIQKEHVIKALHTCINTRDLKPLVVGMCHLPCNFYAC